jgi:hypothetical protein
MFNTKKREMVVYFGILATVFLSFLLASSSKSEKIAETEIVSFETITPIFGRSEAGGPGAFDASQVDNQILVSYRFIPKDAANIDKELGLELAPKIQQFFKKFKTINTITFGLYIPRVAGQPEFKPYVSFDITRKVMNETVLLDLLATDILKVAENVKYFE